MNLSNQFQKFSRVLFSRFRFSEKNFPFLLCALVVSFCFGNLFGLLTKQFGLYISVVGLGVLEFWHRIYYAYFEKLPHSATNAPNQPTCDITATPHAGRTSMPHTNPSSKGWNTVSVGYRPFATIVMHSITRGFLLGLYVDAFRVGS